MNLNHKDTKDSKKHKRLAFVHFVPSCLKFIYLAPAPPVAQAAKTQRLKPHIYILCASAPLREISFRMGGLL